MKNAIPIIGIIGGSGFCSFPELTIKERVKPQTKYGLPSDEIYVGEYRGTKVAFLPRHGSKHSHSPHRVPYKANLLALMSLGVKKVIGTCIAGSLRKEIFPGDFVVPDQFVNLTWGRDDYYEQDRSFVHLPMADPYCSSLRQTLIKAVKSQGITVHNGGTVVVIQGPRFSTLAESKWYISNGWDLVNMTQYPECYLARELGLCYASVAMITDYDAAVREGLRMQPSDMDEVLKVFWGNIQRGKKMIFRLIEDFQNDLANCSCATEYKEYYKQI